MPVLVFMRDGRTVLRLAKRGLLSALIGRDPANEDASTIAWRGTFNPVTGEYVWVQAPLRAMNKGGISWVEEDRGQCGTPEEA